MSPIYELSQYIKSKFADNVVAYWRADGWVNIETDSKPKIYKYNPATGELLYHKDIKSGWINSELRTFLPDDLEKQIEHKVGEIESEQMTNDGHVVIKLKKDKYAHYQFSPKTGKIFKKDVGIKFEPTIRW